MLTLRELTVSQLTLANVMREQSELTLQPPPETLYRKRLKTHNVDSKLINAQQNKKNQRKIVFIPAERFSGDLPFPVESNG